MCLKKISTEIKGWGAFELTLWSSTAWSTKQVGQESGVSRLLISHKLNEESVARSQASSCELLLRECRENVVEEIELDPFLV